MSTKSNWFSSFVVHPSWPRSLRFTRSRPITANPGAAQAVADAQKGATEIGAVAIREPTPCSRWPRPRRTT